MERGFAALSIEAVAAKAGVGKTTIYRRYPGKLELVIASMSNFMHLDEAPDTGSFREDLLAFHSHKGHGFSLQFFSGPGSAIVGTVLSERETHPELLETFRRLVTDKRRKQFQQVVDRARARGEIGDDVECDYVASVIFGSMIARALSGMPVSNETIKQTIDNMINGLRKR